MLTPAPVLFNTPPPAVYDDEDLTGIRDDHAVVKGLSTVKKLIKTHARKIALGVTLALGLTGGLTTLTRGHYGQYPKKISFQDTAAEKARLIPAFATVATNDDIINQDDDDFDMKRTCNKKEVEKLLPFMHKIIKKARALWGSDQGEIVLVSGERPPKVQKSILCYGNAKIPVPKGMPIDKAHCPLDPDRPSVARHSQHPLGRALDVQIAFKDKATHKLVKMTKPRQTRLTDIFIHLGANGVGVYPEWVHFHWRKPGHKDNYVTTWLGIPAHIRKIELAHGYKNGVKAENIDRSLKYTPDFLPPDKPRK